ncbi:carbohydrate-binding protein [Kribbella sp. NPDC051770]|uniref:carbohydrate-binding protein n=1 Tax=Kribbella sp. NPDC051770 TaxID=3155413 RepID=UPI003439F0BA
MKSRWVVAASATIAVSAAPLIAPTSPAPAYAAPTGTPVAVTATSLAGDQLTPKPGLTFSALATVPDVRVDATRQFQPIEGYGATFNEAGWDTLNKPNVSSAQRTQVMSKLFNPTSGAGFTIARTPIGSSDFALTHYSYDETAGNVDDFALSNFSVAHDDANLVPYIQAAKAQGAFRLMASPWTAPGWMKDNKSLLGQNPLMPGVLPYLVKPSVNPQYYTAYANYFQKYVAAYAARGITIDDVSVQNEPENPAAFEATKWDFDQMSDFVGNYLGPTFAATSTNTKIRIYEHNQDHWYYPANILNDTAAREYTGGVDFHPYECDFGPAGNRPYCVNGNVNFLEQVKPGYSTWMSEHTDLGQAEPDNYIRDEKWGRELVAQTNGGRNAYIYWNMVLDQNGGPVTPLSAPQEPLVEVDTSTNPATISYLPKYYQLGQFSKFVKPGAHRIAAEGGKTGSTVVQTAFENPDGQRVLVAVNSGPQQNLTVGEDAAGFTATLAEHSTTTFTWSGARTSYAIDAGATIGSTDHSGTKFDADGNFTGGSIASTSAAIANTPDDALYQKTRDGNFSYALAVPTGRYRVTLQLSDNTSTANGQRVFNVVAEGATQLSVDAFQAAGGGKKATSKTFDLAVTDGTLNLSTVATTGTATVAGIMVNPLPAVGQPYKSIAVGTAGFAPLNTGVLPGTLFGGDYNVGGQGAGYQIATRVASTSPRQDGVNLVTSTGDGEFPTAPGINNLATGDRVNYTANVLSGGNFDVHARVSSTVSAQYRVELDGVSLGSVPFSSTGGGWSTMSLYGKQIPAGVHTLTFVVESGTVALHYLEGSRVNEIAGGAVIEAEDYGPGGQGNGYSDSSGNNGNATYQSNPLYGYYRGGDVDLEPSSSDGTKLENYDVGSTADGEWLRYDFYTPNAASYTISARVASEFTSGRIRYAVDSPTNVANVVSPAQLTVPNTGGWQTWIDIAQPVNLPAGAHALYVRIETGGFNLDRLTITPTGQGWAKTVNLGDNFSAGPGVTQSSSPNSRGYVKSGTTVTIKCERARWNQVQYLADTLGRRDTTYDASCPGDKSESIANATNPTGTTSTDGDEIAEAADGYSGGAPGTGALGSGTDTVTVTIGANDTYTSTDTLWSGTILGQMTACIATTTCVDSGGNPTNHGPRAVVGRRPTPRATCARSSTGSAPTRRRRRSGSSATRRSSAPVRASPARAVRRPPAASRTRGTTCRPTRRSTCRAC